MFTVQTVRIYPSKETARTLDSWMNNCRRVWNHFLEHRIKIYKRRKESTHYMTQTAMLTQWRVNDEKMRAVSRTIQADAVKRLQLAFDGFFRRIKAGETPGFPRFKGPGRWKSLSFTETGRQFVRNGKIYIPKIGVVRCRNLRPVVGQIKSLVVVKRADRWFAKLLIDTGTEPPAKVPVKLAVGVDLGLESFVTLSDGTHIAQNREFRRTEKKLRRANRAFSKKRGDSKRRRKARIRRARLHMKIADRRSDFSHKLSKAIVQTYDLIAVEDLNVQGMMKCSRISKSIKDAAWTQFVLNIAYKAEKAGKTFVRVAAHFTSQFCSQCGDMVQKPIEVRVHCCPKCGLSIDRDLNAARNILARAVPPVGREFTHGETPTPGTRKRVGARRRTVKI